jgi:hypothetical protein
LKFTIYNFGELLNIKAHKDVNLNAYLFKNLVLLTVPYTIINEAPTICTVIILRADFLKGDGFGILRMEWGGIR